VARKVVETFVSDLSGEEIKEADAWIMELKANGAGRPSHRLDLSTAEAEAFTSKVEKIAYRGRQPGAKNKPREAKPDPK
jgi:hypothetical protein